MIPPSQLTNLVSISTSVSTISTNKFSYHFHKCLKEKDLSCKRVRKPNANMQPMQSVWKQAYGFVYIMHVLGVSHLMGIKSVTNNRNKFLECKFLKSSKHFMNNMMGGGEVGWYYFLAKGVHRNEKEDRGVMKCHLNNYKIFSACAWYG